MEGRSIRSMLSTRTEMWRDRVDVKAKDVSQ